MLGVSRCKMRHLQTKVGHLQTILGGSEDWMEGQGTGTEVNPKVGRVLLACSLVYSESVVIKRRGSFVMNHRCQGQ